MKLRKLLLIAISLPVPFLLAISTGAKVSQPTQAALTPTPVPPGVSIPGQTLSTNTHSDLPDCRECHWEIYLIWENSLHGKGLSCAQCHMAAGEEDSHARSGHGAQGGGSQECMGCHTTGYDSETDTWSEGDIHCTACHNPIDPSHPETPAPIDRSADLCGKCHIQANFEWQVSSHGAAGVTCVDCHNQHRTSLKVGSENILEQCATCHETIEIGFTSSLHAKEGLTCADCHLALLENNPVGRGNAKLNHTFNVDVSVCMECHGDMLHKPYNNTQAGEGEFLGERGSYDAMSSIINASVNPSPPLSNPTGFLGFASALGVGVGLGGVLGVARLLQKTLKRKQTNRLEEVDSGLADKSSGEDTGEASHMPPDC